MGRAKNRGGAETDVRKKVNEDLGGRLHERLDRYDRRDRHDDRYDRWNEGDRDHDERHDRRDRNDKDRRDRTDYRSGVGSGYPMFQLKDHKFGHVTSKVL